MNGSYLSLAKWGFEGAYAFVMQINTGSRAESIPSTTFTDTQITVERSTYDILGVEPGPGVPEAKRLFFEAKSAPDDPGEANAGCAVGTGCGWTAVMGTKWPWM